MASSSNADVPPQPPALLSTNSATRIASTTALGEKQTYPKRRIIVACDGTWNASDLDGRALTNVARIVRCVADIDDWDDPKNDRKHYVSQIVHYQPGIGIGTGQLENGWDAFTGRGMCPKFGEKAG
jgi:uncharacterized protein (DUF2235 family)